MLVRVVSGGQTGADQAAWRAAIAAGLTTAGVMPLGFETEDGPRPEFAATFGAVALDSADPAARTRANVRRSDATLVFHSDPIGPGTQLTIDEADRLGRPCLVARFRPPSGAIDDDPARIAREIARLGVRTLNVAGERESLAPGIGAAVEAFLGRVFAELVNRTG